MIPKLSGYPLPNANELPRCQVDWKIEPSRAALLIHDMQDYFVDFWGHESDFIRLLVARIKHLRSLCKSQGIPIFYTAQPIDQKREDRGLLNDMWGPGITTHSGRQQIVTQLAPEEGDFELCKWRYSAFQRSPLQAMLKEQGRDQLLICGVYAHIGCLTTATDAFMNDIQPFMIADALADFSLEKHLIALSIAAGCSSQIMTVAAVAERLVESDIQKMVSNILEEDESEEWPDDAENLVDYGLDSVKIMAFAGRWQRVYPQVDFTKLAQEPTIASWRSLLTV